MTTLVEQMRKYIDIIEDAVSNENRNLRYCYIDISTATRSGETAIRIFPKEGRNKYFTDVVRDVTAKLRDISEIIDEAKIAGESVRIAIFREDDFHKKLTSYVACDKENYKIIKNILSETKKLSELIKL